MLIVLYLSLQKASDKQCLKEFQKFELTYKKSYLTIPQRELALFNFCKNLNLVLEHNSDGNYKLALNENSDLARQRPSGYIEVPIELDYEPTTPQTLNRLSATYPHSTPYTDPGQSDTVLNTFNRLNASDIMTQCAPRANMTNSFTLSGAMRTAITFPTAVLPLRVDLRKLGTVPRAQDQGSCGSCYAHASRNVFTSLVSRDLTYYLQQPGLTRWNLSTADLVFSVQYMLNRTFGANQYCSGGNYQYVATDLANYRINSMEMETDFPYTSMFESDSKVYTSAPAVPDAKIPVNERINPIYYFGFNTIKYNCPKSFFRLTQNPTTKTFDAQDEELIKSVLARGIAIAGSMHTEGGTEAENSKFNVYSSGIFSGSCSKGTGSNHQITYVGYGTYQGKPVWVIQNSWGTSWGIQGTFMIERGKNAMCTEATIDISLNRYFGFDADQDVPFEQSDAYKTLKGSKADVGKNYIDLNENRIVYAVNGLDNEDGTWIQAKVHTSLIIVVVVMALAGLVILYFLSVWLCCPPQNLVKPTIYVKFSEQQAKGFDWSKADENEKLK
ncbi:Papain_family cysteine protease [Hexamita inflata]|uniref:Papain family cysteine protease n=1 Tax=Hexamita inflata TaxID=28002 RepID=A0AA86PUQ0_9EUKA|nr:Papain family cysteine protease [Hexamita inflata]